MMEMEEIEKLFYQEVLEMLEEAACALVEAENRGQVAEQVPELFRMFHSIKGGAQMVALDDLSRLSHQLEYIFDAIREGRRNFDSELVSLVMEVIEVIENALKCRARGEDDSFWRESQVNLLKKIKLLEKCSANEKPSSADISERKPAQLQADMERPHKVEAVIKRRRWLRISFQLEEDSIMPEVTLVLLETRYGVAGNLLQGSCQRDSIKLLLNTDWSDEELLKWCNAIDVKKIRIEDLLEEKKAEENLPSFSEMVEGHRLFLDLQQAFANGRSEEGKLRRLLAWSRGKTGGVEERLHLLTDCMRLYGGLELRQENRVLYQRLLRHAWEEIYRRTCNKIFYFAAKWTELESDKVVMPTKENEKGFYFLDISGWPLEEGIDDLAEFERRLDEKNIVLLLWSGEGSSRYRIALEAWKECDDLTVEQSPFEACFFKREKES